MRRPRRMAAAVIPVLLAGMLSLSTATRAAADTATDDPIDQAVAVAAASSAESGVTSYISVIDRSTGTVVAETDNAHTQVASESIMKLFIATYYAVKAGGAGLLSADRADRLSYMIRFSDDDMASNLFVPDIIPTVAARYGLTETANATPSAGQWGAARITAHDMAQFLYQMSKDPMVGDWLLGIMAEVEPKGSDGHDQLFGFNALDGAHGSKQGWGFDNEPSKDFDSKQPAAVHSVGYTDQWFAAILQTGSSGKYRGTMNKTGTFSAQQIQAATRAVPDAGRVQAALTAVSTPLVNAADALIVHW